MLISAITSLIITALIFSFAVFPSKPGFSLNIFSALAGDKGEVLGVGEENIGKVLADETKTEALPVENQPSSPRKLPEAQNFEITAKSVVAVSSDDYLLFAYRPDEITPIASLTKLMTVLVFLEHSPGWDSVYEIKREDRREGGKIYLFFGEKVTIKDLFYLSLVASDNTATIALVRSSGLSEEEFVQKMNEKAVRLGLSKTKFSDPVGLSDNNVSTAREIASLVKSSLSYQEIRRATTIQAYEFKTLAGKRKKVLTTDYLLNNFSSNGLEIVGGKTGYTDLAGYCFAGEFIDESSKEIITVILGGRSSEERFQKTKELAEWVYNSYEWGLK